MRRRRYSKIEVSINEEKCPKCGSLYMDHISMEEKQCQKCGVIFPIKAEDTDEISDSPSV